MFTGHRWWVEEKSGRERKIVWIYCLATNLYHFLQQLVSMLFFVFIIIHSVLEILPFSPKVQVRTRSNAEVRSTHNVDLALKIWVWSTLSLARTLGPIGSVRSSRGRRGRCRGRRCCRGGSSCGVSGWQKWQTLSLTLTCVTLMRNKVRFVTWLVEVWWSLGWVRWTPVNFAGLQWILADSKSKVGPCHTVPVAFPTWVMDLWPGPVPALTLGQNPYRLPYLCHSLTVTAHVVWSWGATTYDDHSLWQCQWPSQTMTTGTSWHNVAMLPRHYNALYVQLDVSSPCPPTTTFEQATECRCQTHRLCPGSELWGRSVFWPCEVDWGVFVEVFDGGVFVVSFGVACEEV